MLPQMRTPKCPASTTLAIAMQAGETLKAVASASPFPWLSLFASAILSLLEAVEKINENRVELQELQRESVDFFLIVKGVVDRCADAPRLENVLQFEHACTQFARYDPQLSSLSYRSSPKLRSELQQLLKELNLSERKSGRWFKQLLKSNSISLKLAAYRRRLGEIRDRVLVSPSILSISQLS
ncbi:hypothetical protein VKT23_011576 [Stygiomarasmius scandens]|uniref:Uncharacterized protein n=1 Tax=Marasmiellus scandens TaxID=2682957 RepID=A0ABR1JCP9_9AGAR